VEFWRYYRIIRKRRWLIILGMLVCVGTVASFELKSVPMYTGKTTVMESKGMSKSGVALYPEMQYSSLMDAQLRLSNLANIAISNKVMNDAAETLADLGSTYTPLEILQATSVEPVRDTNILAVEVTLPDPEEAKKAADVVASSFKRVYDELNNAAVRQSREFIEAQVAATKGVMQNAQANLRDYKQTNDVVEIAMQAQSNVQRMAQVKSELAAAQAAANAARAAAERLRGELKDLPEFQVVAEQISRDPSWQALNDRIVSLETQKAGMTTGVAGQQRRGPNHPDVLNINAQIVDAREELGAIQEQNKSIEPLSGRKAPEDLRKKTIVSSVSNARNQNYQNAMDRWISTRVDMVMNDARVAAMGNVLTEVRSDLAEMPAKEAALAELQTDLQAATQTYALMRTKLDEAKISEQQAKDEKALKTIDPAYVFPVNQRRILKLVIALLLSPLLGIGVAFLLHYTDNTVKNAVDAEKVLGLPVQAVVPAARAHSLVRQKCPEVVDVAYQMLTSNLWIANQNQGVNSIVMVSAEPDVGRSVTASNLAVALARDGARVILVDADLRQPSQHLLFGVDNKVGLTNLLSGGATLEDVLTPTKVQGLLLVATGPVPANPVKLLRSPEMKDFADQVKELADFVIYDTPAGVAFPDPVLVSAQVGAAIVVHSAGRVARGSEAELRARLESVGVRMLGAVLNKVKREDSSGYYHYYRSYQGVAVAQLPGGKKSAAG